MTQSPQSNSSTALPPATEVRSVACLMLNGIGDIVCVSPAISALKQRYPAARFTALIRPHLRCLLDGSPNIDDFVFYETDRPWQRPLFMWNIYRRRFDLWVDLHVPTFNTVSSNQRDFRRNAWLMRASDARFRRAFAVPELAPYLSHPVAMPSADDLTSVNIVDMTLRLADVGPSVRLPKHVPVTQVVRAWALAQLPTRRSPRIGLFFGSRQSADLWPERRIREFICLLCATFPDGEFVLIGGEHEAVLAATISATAAECRHAALRDFICRASLDQTAALLERCDVLVSTDSGPMHIADAMMVPVVALFSSKNHPEIWRPLYTRLELFNRPVDCGPCFRATCDVGNKCMDLIEPVEVLAALERVLRTDRAGGTPARDAANRGCGGYPA